MSGAVREQDAAPRIFEQDNREFMHARKVEAAIQFTNNPTVVKQEALGTHSLS